MPRRVRPEDLDFVIHLDPSCVSEPMGENEKEMGHGQPQGDVGEAPIAEKQPDSLSDSEMPHETAADELKEPTTENDTTEEPENDTTEVPENNKHVMKMEEELDDLINYTEALGKDQPLPDDISEHSVAELLATTDKPEEPREDDNLLDEEPAKDSEETAVQEDAVAVDGDVGDAESLPRSSLGQTEPEDIHHSETESMLSDSRRESIVSESENITHRRASRRTEALIHEAARNIVARIGHPRDSLQSTPATEDGYSSHSEVTSARNSDAHLSVHDDQASTEDERSGNEGAGDNSSHHDNDSDVFSDHSPRSSVGSISETELNKANDVLNRMTHSARVSGISQYEQDEEFVPTVRGTPRPPFRSPSSVKAIQMSSPPPSVLGSPRSSRRSPRPTISRLGSPSVSAQYSPKKTPPRFRRATPPLVLLHVTLLPLRWGWGDVLDQAETEDLSKDCKTLRDAWRQLQDRMGDTTVERGILLPHPQGDYEVLEERLLEALELPMRRRARILECGHYLGPSNEMTLIDESEEEDEYDEDDRRLTRASMPQKTHWCTTCRSEIRYDSLGPGKIFRVKVYASNGLMKAGAWEACWKEMERVDVELEPILEPGVQEELNQLDVDQQRALEMREAEEDDAKYDHLDDLDEQRLGDYHEDDDHEDDYDELPHDHMADETLHLSETHEERNVEELPEEHLEEKARDHVPDVEEVPEREPTPPPASPEEIHRSAEERRKSDEARFREIYGHSPSAHHEHDDEREHHEHHGPQERAHPTPAEPLTSDYSARQTPPSPSAEAHARREERRQAYQGASLPELLLESARVLMQDKKNVLIALMSVLILALALRGGQPTQPDSFQTIIKAPEVPTVMVTQAVAETQSPSSMASETTTESEPTMENYPMVGVEVAVDGSSVEESHTPSSEAPLPSEPIDPCASCSLSVQNAQESAAAQVEDGGVVGVAESQTPVSNSEEIEQTVRIVETVTEFETATVKITETETETETISQPTQFGEVVEEKEPEDASMEEPEMNEIVGSIEPQPSVEAVSEPAVDGLDLETVVEDQEDDQEFDVEREL